LPTKLSSRGAESNEWPRRIRDGPSSRTPLAGGGEPSRSQYAPGPSDSICIASLPRANRPFAQVATNRPTRVFRGRNASRGVPKNR